MAENMAMDAGIDEDMDVYMNVKTNKDINTDMNTDIKVCLKEYIKPGKRYAVMGIGSTLRSDDGAGIYFIDQLSKAVQRDDVLLIAGSTAPENFTGVIKNFAPSTLFIVDAAYIGLLPGEVKVIPACEVNGVSFSTHMLPLPVMLNYLESEIGCNVIFIGIQPKSTDPGFSMNDDVKKGAEQLAEEFHYALVHYLEVC